MAHLGHLSSRACKLAAERLKEAIPLARTAPHCVTLPTSMAMSTLQTSRSWECLKVKHRRPRRGRDAKGQKQHLCAEGRRSHSPLPCASGFGVDTSAPEPDIAEGHIGTAPTALLWWHQKAPNSWNSAGTSAQK